MMSSETPCTTAANSVCVRTQRPTDDMAHAHQEEFPSQAFPRLTNRNRNLMTQRLLLRQLLQMPVQRDRPSERNGDSRRSGTRSHCLWRNRILNSNNCYEVRKPQSCLAIFTSRLFNATRVLERYQDTDSADTGIFVHQS